MERILDQTRKFGLHAVLAHQRLGQLKERGEGIYNAVMGSTQTKIVLGGLADDDAAIMAREIMRGDIDLTKPKPGITMPVVVDEVPFWLESESSTEGSAYSTAHSEGYGTGEAMTTSQGESATYAVVNPSFFANPSGMSIANGSAVVSNTSRSVVWTEGSTTSHGHTRGRSQTLRPVREERPTHFYSLDESLHLAMLKIRNLPDQTAIVKRRGKRTVQVNTVEVKPVLEAPKMLGRFREKASARSPYVSTSEAVQAEFDRRQLALLGSPAAAKGEEEFWVTE